MSETDTWEKTHTHTDGHVTEKKAARKAFKKAHSIRTEIALCLSAFGEGGLTPDEFSDATGALINTVRRRFTDLWKDGEIKHHPKRITRQNSDGNDCIVWVLGEDKNRKSSKYAEMSQKLEQVKKMTEVWRKQVEHNEEQINTGTEAPTTTTYRRAAADALTLCADGIIEILED